MSSFKLKITAPDKIFFDGESSQIIARTSEGNVGILANHANYVVNLPSGPLKVKGEDGTYRVAAVSSGILVVKNNEVDIVVNAIEWEDEIDVERAKRSEEDARNRIRNKKSQKDFDRANLKLKRALNRLSVAKK